MRAVHASVGVSIDHVFSLITVQFLAMKMNYIYIYIYSSVFLKIIVIAYNTILVI